MRISDWSSDVCSSDLLLHEPRHHARVGAAAGDGGGAAGIARLLPTHRLAQGVVGALGWIGADIEVETEPRLHHGVDVERAKLAAQLHDVKRRDVDREVHAKTLPRSEEHTSELQS